MNEVLIRCIKFPWCKTVVTVRPNQTKGFEGLASLTVETGASRLHTYPTRDELLALADILREHAEKIAEVTA